MRRLTLRDFDASRTTTGFIFWAALSSAVTLLVLLWVDAEAASPRATGTVQVQAFEHDTPAGVIPLGQAVGLRRSARRHVPLAPDPRLIPGAKMAVRGIWGPSGQDLIADPNDPKGVKLLRPPYSTPALPVEHIVVLPVDFPGELEATRAVEDMAGDYLGLQAWVRRSSYGRTALHIEARSWVGADRPLAEVACDFAATVAMAIRLHPEVDYRAVTQVNVVTPTMPWEQFNCLGHGGAGGAFVGRFPVETPDGWVSVGQQITSEEYPASPHELGHALGLQHANALRCTPPGLPADLTTCTNREYGDLFDVMGKGGGDYSAPRKQQLGWLDPATGPEQTLRVTHPGLYVLTPLGVAGQPGSMDVKGLQLPRAGAPPSTWLWVEARTSVGNDWRMPDDWLAGVFLHGALAHLWVANPEGGTLALPIGSTHQITTGDMDTWGDIALPVGGSFYDPPWRVTVVSRTSASTVVEIADVTSTPHPTPSLTPRPTFTCGGSTGGNGGHGGGVSPDPRWTSNGGGGGGGPCPTP